MESIERPKVNVRTRRRFRPRLETLEQRDCPCSNNLLDDGTLLILGDNAANTIVIRDDGTRGVTVQCDRDAPETFLDVRRIVLRSAGGDDRINHLIGNPNETPADLLFDLGEGNDALIIDWINPGDPSAPGAEGRQVVFDLIAGAGNDVVSADFVNPPDGDFVFRADLGADNDALSISWADPEYYDEPQPARHMRFDITGGNGRDDVTAMFMTPRYGELDFGADLGAAADNLDLTFIPTDQFNPGAEVGRFPANFKVQGDGETDRLNVFLGGPDTEPEPGILTGDVLVSLDGGAEGDVVGAIIKNCKIAGSLTMSLEGGHGDDVESVLCSNNLITGHLAMAVASGHGGDEVGIVIINSNVARDGSLAATADLGSGDDRIDLLARDLVLAGDRAMGYDAMFAIDGADGADWIAARVERPIFIGPAVLDLAIRGSGGGDFIEVMGADPAGHQYAAGRAHLNLSISGGGGTDRIHFRGGVDNEPPDLGLQLDWFIVITGDDGADLIDARLRFDPAGQDHIAAEVLGGLGNDDLTLALSGVADPMNVAALLDGGAGFDIARVTRNVLVRNVEEVFLIE